MQPPLITGTMVTLWEAFTVGPFLTFILFACLILLHRYRGPEYRYLYPWNLDDLYSLNLDNMTEDHGIYHRFGGTILRGRFPQKLWLTGSWKEAVIRGERIPGSVVLGEDLGDLVGDLPCTRAPTPTPLREVGGAGPPQEGALLEGER